MTEKIEKSMYNWDVNITFYPTSHQYKKDWENIMSVTTITGVVDKSWPLIAWATNLAKDYLINLIEHREWEDFTKEDIVRACQLHREKKEEAASIGKQAHQWAEDYIKRWDMTLPEDEKVAQAVSWFLDWKTEHNVSFECSEVMVYSKKHNYVWLFDTIGIIDWKRYLIDFKTSNYIYMLEYWMQLTAYLKAYEEELNYWIPEFIDEKVNEMFNEEWEKVDVCETIPNPLYKKLDWVLVIKFAKDIEDKNGNPIPSFEVQPILEIDYFFEAFLAAKVLKTAVKKYEKWQQ